jgi:putative nucleotidyltransferase with HDIG domain
MNRIIKNIQHHLPRYALVGLLVLFISLFFPHANHFRYEFAQGQRWQYESIKAPFDFPIEKTTKQLEQERNLIKEQPLIYYRYVSKTGEEQINNFRKKLQQEYSIFKTKKNKTLTDSTIYLRIGEAILQKLFDTKILALDSSHAQLLARGDDLVFSLLDDHNRLLGEFRPKDFVQPAQAAQMLIDTLSLLTQKYQLETSLLLPLLEEALQTNVHFDLAISQKTKANALEALGKYQGMVKAGDWVVEKGALIDSNTFAVLKSFENRYQEQIEQYKNRFLVYLGYLLLTIALLSIYIIFVQFYAWDVFENLRHFSLLLIMIGSYTYLSYHVHKIPSIELYIVPFCVIPIIVQNFFSAHLALFTHIVVILLTSMILSLDYQFILVQIIVGMVAIITKLKTRYLSDFFMSLLYIGIAYTAGFISLELIHTGSILGTNDANGEIINPGVRWQILGWIAFNVCLTLLSYPLIPLLERLFGLTSEITLVELSDLNNPLLKELSIKAPGTLQHSLQVANLAEAAAAAVGANALLVKVGALYHDIGKTANPQFFVENQTHENPHQGLSCLESAQMIISHVTEGVKLAKSYRLPSLITDFILTHHGTTRVEYFYRTYCKDHVDVDETPFRYPGPRPRNREEAILMMADSLEAASKSLRLPTGYDIDQLVDNIIRGKIAAGQFEDTNLTFQDLEITKTVFKKLLRSIHHVRIEYPQEQKKEG